jgi:arylsulfatase
MQWTKQVASHFGGTRNGLAISWPKVIKDVGGLRSQFCHVIDIVPTIYEACGVKAPDVMDGVPQKPIEGVSLMYSFADAKAPTQHPVQYFELVGNRAIYKDGWMANTTPLRLPWLTAGEANPDDFKWELYNIDEDFSQANNLVDKYPEKLKELQQAFDVEAKKYNVYPLDSSFVPRFDTSIRPSLARGRNEFVYYSGMARIPEGSAPDFKNKSWTIAAEIEIPKGGASGVLATQGGRFGGWGIWLDESKPRFCSALSNQSKHKFVAKSEVPLAPGRHVVRVKFKYDGGGAGKGGTATLMVDEKSVGEVKVPQTLPARISLDETFDIGMDTGTPIIDDYDDKMPYAFTGTLHRIAVVLEPEKLSAEEQAKLQAIMAKAMMAVQ